MDRTEFFPWEQGHRERDQGDGTAPLTELQTSVVVATRVTISETPFINGMGRGERVRPTCDTASGSTAVVSTRTAGTVAPEFLSGPQGRKGSC